MRYLGIDYGSKNVGVALSNEDNTFAFPKAVLKNDKNLISEIKKISQENEVAEIVLGESKDLSGRENKIMKEIKAFKEALEKELNLPVHLEPEFFTSVEAGRLQGEGEKLDSSAAALILKSYLDKFAD